MNNSGHFSFTTFSVTIIVGLVVFILSQLSLRIVIEPIVEFKRIRSNISIALIQYAYIYANPVNPSKENLANDALVEQRDNVRDVFRKLAAELVGITHVIPFYRFFSFIRILPNIKNVNDASASLIGLSKEFKL
jgi:hypothetical protein